MEGSVRCGVCVSVCLKCAWFVKQRVGTVCAYEKEGPLVEIIEKKERIKEELYKGL